MILVSSLKDINPLALPGGIHSTFGISAESTNFFGTAFSSLKSTIPIKAAPVTT
jgi:hypothetical protein